eukprot:Skav209101  [mRNA]  locus=scaffold179:83987:86101:- [translate_table: standard]
MLTDMVELFALLQAQHPETSWLAMVCQDVQRLQHLVPHEELHSLAVYDKVELLARWSVQHPGALPRYAKKAARIYAKYLRVWAISREFQKTFHDDLLQLGVQTTMLAEPRPQPQGFECHECAAVFDSFGALCTHVFKRHKKGNLAPRFAIGNTCRACLKCYRGRTQLIHHLKYFRTKCLLKLMVTVTPLTDEELHDIQVNESEARKAAKHQTRVSAHKLPMVHAHGPILPWPWQRNMTQRSPDTMREPLIEDHWILEIFASVEHLDVHHTLQVLNRQPFHTTLLTHIMQVFTQSYPDNNAVDLEAVEQHLVLQEALALWQESHLQNPVQVFYPIRLQQAASLCQQVRVPQHQRHEHVPTMQERRQQAQARLWEEAHVPTQIRQQLDTEDATVWHWPGSQSRLLVRKPVYLYVFSGRRRQGDYQFHVERFCSRYGECGQVLLIDLALSSLHDVTSPQLLQTFCEWFRCGFIATLLVAPPCETWSQARHQKLPMHPSPRPLRSSRYPFGLDGLTGDELDQVFVSSLLLFVAIRLFLFSIVHQVPGTMEHPKTPTKLERASIWFLPWLKRFSDHPAVQLVAINQAEYGAKSLKPTNLMCCWLSCWSLVSKEHSTPIPWHQLDTLIGLDQHGRWKTSSAKEYPSALNAAIAHSHVHQIFLQRSAARVAEDTPAHQAHFEELYHGDGDLAEQAMQPDYARNCVALDRLD